MDLLIQVNLKNHNGHVENKLLMFKTHCFNYNIKDDNTDRSRKLHFL